MPHVVNVPHVTIILIIKSLYQFTNKLLFIYFESRYFLVLMIFKAELLLYSYQNFELLKYI